MIKVTRINREQIVVNAELIEFLEETPDSIISLTTGKKLAVVETIDEIIDMIIRYRQQIHNSCRLTHGPGNEENSRG
ncbi:MAG: flagellar FlbD family protein [Candidatus Xenobiia bacterium LiM19]